MFDPTETPRSCSLTSDALDALEDAAAAIGSREGKMSLVRAKRREVLRSLRAQFESEKGDPQ